MLRDSLERHSPEALDFLRELVEINSFTLNRDGVNKNAQRIIRRFAALGFDKSVRFPCGLSGAGDHLMLDTGGDGPVIACISHLDTVFSPEEEAMNHFHWQPAEEGRIYGPGTMDIKGGTVMIWLMLRALLEVDPVFFRSIRWMIACNAAEEPLVADFSEACFSYFPKEVLACLVFEADSGVRDQVPLFRVLEARKGIVKFQVDVTGRGAHAGVSHEKGVNAILQISRIIERLQAMTDYARGVTVNVGTVTGGSVFNRVPHHASAMLEMRAYDPAIYQETRAAILALPGSGDVTADSDGFPCQVRVREIGDVPPWQRNERTDALISIWKATAKECDIELASISRGGISDGNFLAQRYPTLDGLGPRGANAHVSERSADGNKVPEYVDATSFVPKALINLLAIRKLMRGQ